MENNLDTKNNDRVIFPPVDIYENDSEFVVVADIPGVDKSNIDITINDNKLEINGKISNKNDVDSLRYREFYLQNYYRAFNVGSVIDSNAINATVVNGVLTLKLPKRNEVKPRKIEISVN